MVWKAAAQTRFRVFKHENGITVRVIACFQPLQNCQAEYFLAIQLGEVPVHLNILLVVLLVGLLFMGDKVNPWFHWPNPSWKFNIDSSADNLYQPDAGLDDTKSVALPTYVNDHSYIYPGVAAPTPFLTASVADRPLSMPSRFVTTLAPGLELSAVYPPHKRPLVLYQKGNHTPITAPLLSRGMLDPVLELQGSNETDVTDVGAEDTEGIHENTDEINALLDSDSDEGCERVHELGKATQSPAENDTLSVESVASADASAGAERPAKKRRVCSGTDKSVVDTASSARPDHFIDQKLLASDCDAQSCCIGEVESDHKFSLREGEAAEDDCLDDQERRRERIQETVAALRKIVPGGIAKDATAVLDEAICYLQYLKLKVKTLGAVSL
ncbi:hypothetical protein QOZ80_3AG0250970 [Eleusine coracana subsp. coracana]|nr:hypothetical protein QOZ80_3AG0250970 [Eleusine coracana subsp. coracana]